MNRNLGTNITRLKLQNTYVVYENFTKCTVKDYEFNYSYNPTLLSGSQGLLTPYSASNGGSIVYVNTGSNSDYGILKYFATGSISGSEFSPYVTVIGLYNDADELLAVGKMAAPMPLSSTTDTTFLIKYDLDFVSEQIPMPSPSPTPSITPSVTPSISVTPSLTPSVSVTPTVTTTPSVTPTVTPTVTVSATAATTPSVTPTVTTTPTQTPTVTPTATPSVTVTPTLTPTPTQSPAPPTYYKYTAEIRYCTSCGFNSGEVTVQSLSPLTLFTYAVEYPVPSPVTVSYKIIASTTNPASITVIGAGSSCLNACTNPPFNPE